MAPLQEAVTSATRPVGDFFSGLAHLPSLQRENQDLKDQLAWLKRDLARLPPTAPVVVFTHRPLFDLYPEWDWFTRDGAKAIELLRPYSNVTVFYGHIHQEHHHKTDKIWHHAAKGLMFPLPAPGSVPKKLPVPWKDTSPYKGLGFRGIEAKGNQAKYGITEFGVRGEKL